MRCASRSGRGVVWCGSERRANCAQIRPFEERVMCSLAFQIVVLPLSKRLTKTSEENVRNYVAAAAEEQTSMQCYKEMMTDLAMQITGRNVSPSVQFVKNALSEGGFSEGGFSTDSPSACMSIKVRCFSMNAYGEPYLVVDLDAGFIVCSDVRSGPTGMEVTLLEI
eukprot:gb/GECG01000443.1/.p1 GENE.gb/GECG01000443.1/~~gb/GECG01000443.1/.p1  ORF type:complete len:166 (+),score=13.17 gb/GECG01000443.1/:1-498(+)